MVADMLFEIAIMVFIFLAIGIGLTIYEYKTFVHPDDEEDK